MNTPEVQRMLHISGVPLPAGTQFNPTADDMLNVARRRAFAGLTPGGASERAMTGVPSEAVAGATERTAIAGAGRAEADTTTAQAQANVAAQRAAAQLRGEQAQATILEGEAATTPTKVESTIAQNRTQAEIYNGTMRLLHATDAQGRPTPAAAQIRRIAEYAATGALPYLIAQLQRSGAGADRDLQRWIARATLGLNTLGLITKETGDAAATWDAGLERARLANGSIMAATVAGVNPPEEIVAAVTNRYIADHGPRPTFEATQATLGLNTADFGDVGDIITNVVTGGRGTLTADPSRTSDPARVAEIVTYFTANPTDQSVTELTQMYNTGRITGDDLRSVRAGLVGKVPDNIMRGIDIIVSHIGQRPAVARPSVR
jgi:hypothetical protein